MRKIDRLKKEALESCRFRGHDMKRFQRHDYYKKTIAVANCQKCDMQVAVNTKPLPNDIEIGGEAVALNCEGTK